MTVAKTLNISKCNLTVNGTLTVNEGITLTTKTVSVSTSNTYGLNLLGSMTVNGNLTCKGAQYGCYAAGTDATSGTLKVTGNVTGTTTTTGNVTTYGFYARSTMTVNIGGTLTGTSSAATGTTNGIFINSKNAVITGAINGTSNGTKKAYGVYISGNAVVTAKSTVTGTSKVLAQTTYQDEENSLGIYVKSGGKLTVTGNIVANHKMVVRGTCVVNTGNVTVKDTTFVFPALVVSGTLQTNAGSVTSTGGYNAITVASGGVLKSAKTITATTTEYQGIYTLGTISATDITATATNGFAGISQSNVGSITATGTISGTGNSYGISSASSITAKIVRGKGNSAGIDCFSGTSYSCVIKATSAVQYCSVLNNEGTISPTPVKNCNW